MNDSIYCPIFLDISKKSCLVVGGGGVAERKVYMLLKFKARINVVSPRISRLLRILAEKGKIHIALKEYDENDLDGVALVFAATNIEAVNRRIREDAGRRNIPVNVVDNPSLCDFIVPSIVKKDPIIIAISTSGMLPYLSKKLRKDIAERITGDYVRYASIVGRFRKHLISRVADKKLRQSIMKKVSKVDINEINGMGFNKIIETYLRTEE